MTTRRQLLKVKVSACALLTFFPILHAPRGFQRQRSRKSRYMRCAIEIDRIDKHLLGCRCKNYSPCLRIMRLSAFVNSPNSGVFVRHWA